MNNIRLARKLVELAKIIKSSEENEEKPGFSGEIGFEDFKKHLSDALNNEAQNMQKLYDWYRNHYNVSTRSIDVSDEIQEVKKILEEMAQYVQDTEEDDIDEPGN